MSYLILALSIVACGAAGSLLAPPIRGDWQDYTTKIIENYKEYQL